MKLISTARIFFELFLFQAVIKIQLLLQLLNIPFGAGQAIALVENCTGLDY